MRKILVMASVMMLGASGAWALGTTADTQIDNTATLSYDVGSSTLTATSVADQFKVDKKVDMIMNTSDGSHLEVHPNQQDAELNFDFKNEGNANQYFKFEVENLSGAGAASEDEYAVHKIDNAEADNLEIQCTYTKADGTVETTAWATSLILEMKPDVADTCKVRGDIPNASANNDVMNIQLKATAVTDNTGGTAETESAGDSADQMVVDVVLADGDTVHNGSDANGLGSKDADDTNNHDTEKDGIELARGGYWVTRPILGVSKSSCVYSDPVNGVSATAKRIPGAYIMYVVDIENTGSQDGSNITFKDTLQGELLGDTVKSGKAHTADNVTVETDVDSCSCSDGVESANGSDSDDKDADAQKIEIQNISVAKTKHTCLSFTVEID